MNELPTPASSWLIVDGNVCSITDALARGRGLPRPKKKTGSKRGSEAITQTKRAIEMAKERRRAGYKVTQRS